MGRIEERDQIARRDGLEEVLMVIRDRSDLTKRRPCREDDRYERKNVTSPMDLDESATLYLR